VRFFKRDTKPDIRLLPVTVCVATRLSEKKSIPTPSPLSAGPFRVPSRCSSLQWFWLQLRLDPNELAAEDRLNKGADHQTITLARQLSRIPATSLGLSPAHILTSELPSQLRPLHSLLDCYRSWDKPSPHLSLDLPCSIFYSRPHVSTLGVAIVKMCSGNLCHRMG